MNEYYDYKKEYFNHLKNLSNYDSDGRSHEQSHEFINDYKESE